MFDISGPELLVIAVIALIVIGPKELPGAIRAVAHWVRKAKGLASEFRSGLDDMVREAELKEVKDDIERSIDPGEIRNSIEGDLRHSLDPDGDVEDALRLEGDWYSPEEELYDFVKDDVGHVDDHIAAAEASARKAAEGAEPVTAGETAGHVSGDEQAGEADEPPGPPERRRSTGAV